LSIASELAASELAAPFSEALVGLIGAGFIGSDNDRICLAVSGGPDSLALLLLANELLPNRIVAATVDHGLRTEAAEETEFVASICTQLGVLHAVLKPEAPITGNLQSAARKVRYALLENFAATHDCKWIATAHHADDQLETFLMRLARGSGVDGLASIRAVNGRVIRPLLGFSKRQLEEICDAAGITPVRDPSNDDEDFDRVRMRKWLQESGIPFDVSAAGKSAAALHDASQALDWMCVRLAATHVKADGAKVKVDCGGLPNEMQRRLLIHALGQLQPDYVPRGEKLERALTGLRSGEKVMLGDVSMSGGKLWTLETAPPRKSS
jgi:tRNA(Ile)-lysidine synthase